MVNFISNERKLDFSDVLLVPQRGGPSSRSLVVLERNFLAPYSGATLSGNGVIAANMDGVGTFAVANTLSKYGVHTALTKNLNETDLINFFREGIETDEDHAADYSFYSMGIGDADLEKFNRVMKQVTLQRVCIDVANGYMDNFYDFISLLREQHPDLTIMAGNVVTPEGVEDVYGAGADIVKVGIGSGGVCTTRLIAGVGYPQFSAVSECAEAADELGVLVCSDGGCVEPGDVAKAIAGGADFVMLGSMLAGTTEGGMVDENGDVQFYGMSSKTANDKHFGGLKNYRSSEGRTVKMNYKGDMSGVIQRVLGGITSACTYSACHYLEELPIKAIFAKVNNTHNRSLEAATIGY